MKRPEHWPELMASFLEEWSAVPFEWGVSDCGHFAAAWMSRLGYVDPLAGIHWDSALSAFRIIKAAGGMDHLVSAQMRAVGCAEVGVKLAWRGDIALVDVEARQPVLGIVVGQSVAVRAEQVNIGECPRTRALKTWRT